MSERIVIPNEILLGEVTSMLNEGRKVILLTRGNSMLPFIRGDRDSVELERLDTLAVGDIVLAHLADKRYVLHRVLGIEGDNITLMGDGNIIGTESCLRADICGTATKIIRPDGREKDCRSPKAMRRARLWRRLRPVRRYILAIYRRII